jgi:hypothetical protein
MDYKGDFVFHGQREVYGGSRPSKIDVLLCAWGLPHAVIRPSVIFSGMAGLVPIYWHSPGSLIMTHPADFR